MDRIIELKKNAEMFYTEIALSDVADVYTGKQLNKSDMSNDGLYAVMNGGIEPSGYTNNYNEEENTITISQGGASAGYVNWNSEKIWIGAHCYAIHPIKNKINNRYLYFVLKEKQEVLMQSKQGAGIPGLNRSIIQKLYIPLPHIKVQEEIVEILDSFTNLIDTLNEELSLRQKQFEYYREKLLTFDDNVKKIKLEEIGSFYGGLSGKSKEDFNGGNKKYVSYMNIFTNSTVCLDIDDKVKVSEDEKQNKITYGDILFTGSSETPDECGMTSVVTCEINEDIYLNSFSFGYRFNNLNGLFPKFFSFLMRSHFIRDEITKTANGVTRFNVSKKLLGKVMIPIPPLSIQKSIVEKLDAFESLISSLKEEIALRQKQYEYYREKLLTFD